jgi:hypothetical protein
MPEADEIDRAAIAYTDQALGREIRSAFRGRFGLRRRCGLRERRRGANGRNKN